MLQNAYFLAKIGADTAEDEQHFAEILPTDALEPAQQPEAPLPGGARPLGPRGRGAPGGGRVPRPRDAGRADLCLFYLQVRMDCLTSN